ncbi:hypothetical protein [Hydrogenophaga sp.]|uniref:hypothetical protein n=1 Tax=Hydrogenophaga sp. TaxID=1904254 RepID=UPI0027202443|nr:hypothetical protein [Hydrogenophaga sp.]MDO8904328.1 hypothetical protein [Hydrogenophaga sp.]
MDVYIIIGNANTRKASLVRSLTGCFNRSVREILLQGSKRPHRFYARVGTLQDTRTTIDQFVQELTRARCEAAVFCLSPGQKPDQPDLPDAQTYVAAMRKLGWRIKGIAVLGQNDGGLRAPNLRQYPQAPAAPVNVTAREVRAQFGWV